MDEMWNTKVFVDKLPKSCNDCVVDHCGEWCCLNCVDIDTWSYDETRPKDCPLQSLADYTKRARKEVCKKFVEQFMLEYTMGNEPVEDIIYKVAEQIQGE